ncbi:hypothetical protein BDN71DRAFT_1453162 [Pleurotus eryngii]|uniref:Uncharacterized protein n=1 Tax=Pleurotus eryngii TaxID=5323 RepID=A0A9P6DDD7_PLEER|nr:hypothetical protein BDN71DRAFT_1453162 [Pleurotus eryngii]
MSGVSGGVNMESLYAHRVQEFCERRYPEASSPPPLLPQSHIHLVALPSFSVQTVSCAAFRIPVLRLLSGPSSTPCALFYSPSHPLLFRLLRRGAEGYEESGVSAFLHACPILPY